MRSLIINIDRDNDFGMKAGVEGPVIGYADCYNAALRLISTDPEDSDGNGLFGALKHYEDLKRRGEDVEIALITGDDDVGEKSDEIIAAQIDDVLSNDRFDDVILVSDGAEDDYIIPIIASRIKIRYVKHIIVRHNQNIESMYYYIVRAVKDKKIARKFTIPVGLVFLTYGISALIFTLYTIYAFHSYYIDPSAAAIMLVTIVLGSYFIERGLEIRSSIRNILSRMITNARETKISFLFSVISILIVLSGIVYSYTATIKYGPVIDKIFVFIAYFVWWAFAAFLIREIGIYIENIIVNNENVKPWFGILFMLSLTFIIYGMINYMMYAMSFISFSSAVISISLIIIGIVVAVTSSFIHRYYRSDADEA
ncbi:DUF373 family protein [Picrophilus oshimae]|uniref:Hypothetical transmembrane protein DUF 373 n=1 Tax=Picrophilus torridus (strain ATCC 700027 / DSM 9790 / JCM 10055 / NBRC 100828 / KAW 2/3) TaxID=1122961 RepID=Q6L1Y3_PICTO|nr:DUF373 family protein [Picrophilus oshimae]AAT43019.1 hypothetical transmembrane protein DUF 373 [Picrophilus oshimae DSM 9789]